MIKFTEEQKVKYLNYVLSHLLSVGGPENLDGMRLRDYVYKGSYKKLEIDNFNQLTQRMNEKYNLDMSYIAEFFRLLKISQILDPLVDISYNKV